MTDWIFCPSGKGYRHEGGRVSNRLRHFRANAVGVRKSEDGTNTVVWLIGTDEFWSVASSDIRTLNVRETGDKFEIKICNVCHCLLPVDSFDPNQNNLHGIVRRPSCKRCRTDIDKRAPKTNQAKQAEKNRPKKGTPFKCPICQGRFIVGVTARIVADHDHHTGNIRDFICDRCNTGLGRFKNGKDCLRDALAYIEERESSI